MLILDTKKDLPEGSLILKTKKASPGAKAGGLAGGPVHFCWQVAVAGNKGGPEGQFAYPGDKKRAPARGPVRLRESVRSSWKQRRRTCRRASSLVGTKKEPAGGPVRVSGDKEGGGAAAGESWGQKWQQRRKTCWRAIRLIQETEVRLPEGVRSLILGTMIAGWPVH